MSEIPEIPQGQDDNQIDAITTDINEPNFFTMIPNMVIELLTDPDEFRVYAHYRKIAGNGGKCHESRATTAKNCGMSEGRLHKVRLSLERKGLINIQDRSEDGKSNLIGIISVWKENNIYYWQKHPERYADNLVGLSPRDRGGCHQLSTRLSSRDNNKESLSKEPIVLKDASASLETTNAIKALMPTYHKVAGENAPWPKYAVLAKFLSGGDIQWPLGGRKRDVVSGMTTPVTPEEFQKFTDWIHKSFSGNGYPSTPDTLREWVGKYRMTIAPAVADTDARWTATHAAWVHALDIPKGDWSQYLTRSEERIRNDLSYYASTNPDVAARLAEHGYRLELEAEHDPSA